MLQIRLLLDKKPMLGDGLSDAARGEKSWIDMIKVPPFVKKKDDVE